MIRKKIHFLHFFDIKMHHKIIKKNGVKKEWKWREIRTLAISKNSGFPFEKPLFLKNDKFVLCYENSKKYVWFSIHFCIVFLKHFFRFEIYHFFNHFEYQKLIKKNSSFFRLHFWWILDSFWPPKTSLLAPPEPLKMMLKSVLNFDESKGLV